MCCTPNRSARPFSRGIANDVVELSNLFPSIPGHFRVVAKIGERLTYAEMLKVAIESYPYEQAYLSEIYEALKQTYPCFQVSVAVRGGGRAHESPPLFFRRVCPTLVLSSIVCSCCARCFRACQSINPALLSPQQTADSASWKNSVRHNLSIHSQFQRIAMVDSIRVRNSGTTGRRTKGSAGLWTVLNTAVSFRHHRRWWCCLRPSLYLLLEAMVLASQWKPRWRVVHTGTSHTLLQLTVHPLALWSVAPNLP